MPAWLHATLALALVLAQALGLLHRTAHAPHAPHAVDHAATASLVVALPAVDEQASTSLFGHAAGQGDACRLFDQLALADLLVHATPALPVFDAPRRAIDATGAPRAWAVTTAYRARAPPAIG